MRTTWFAMTIIFGLVIIYGCGEKIKPADSEVERPEVSGVVIEEVMPIDSVDYYEATGTVRAKNTALVSARIMGEVKDIKVGTGDKVRKGDVLLLIHSPDIESKVEAAKEALGEAGKGLQIAEERRELMKTTYERFRMLHEGKAVTAQEFDEVKAKKDIAHLQYEQTLKSLKKAEAGLKEAEAIRDYAVIRSPQDGIVAEKNIDRGSMTSPGMTLFVIEGPSYRVEVPVDEGFLSLVKPDMPADIFIRSMQLHTKGRVGEIVHQIDPRSRTFTVKVDRIEISAALRGGSYAQVKFPVGQTSRLYIQESSIVNRGELKGVYAVDHQGVITFRLIRTGKKKEGMAQVLSGLHPGDRIITKGTDRALDGGRVKED